MITLLFIEDDELMSEMYPLLLREPDFKTEVIKNGKLGIDRAIKWQPDVILLDMMMPEMNGLEVLEALKALPSTNSIPVIMLSNLYDEEFIEQALKKGAAAYFIKSEFTGKQIRVKIKEVLSEMNQKQN